MQVKVCLRLTLKRFAFEKRRLSRAARRSERAYQQMEYVEEQLRVVDQVAVDQVLLDPAGEALVDEPQLALRLGGVHRLHVLHARLQAVLQVLHDVGGRAREDSLQVVTSVLAKFEALVADLFKTKRKTCPSASSGWARPSNAGLTSSGRMVKNSMSTFEFPS